MGGGRGGGHLIILSIVNAFPSPLFSGGLRWAGLHFSSPLFSSFSTWERKGTEWEHIWAAERLLRVLCPRLLSRSRSVATFSSLTAQLRAFINHRLCGAPFSTAPPEKTLLTSCASPTLAQNLPISARDGYHFNYICCLADSSGPRGPRDKAHVLSRHLMRHLAHGVLHSAGCLAVPKTRLADAASWVAPDLQS